MNEADVFMDGIEVVVDDIEDEGLYDFKIIDFEEGAEEVGAEGRLGGEARLQWEWHDLHPTHESLVLSVTLLIVALVSTFLLLRLLRRRASPVGRRDKSHLEGASDIDPETISWKRLIASQLGSAGGSSAREALSTELCGSKHGPLHGVNILARVVEAHLGDTVGTETSALVLFLNHALGVANLLYEDAFAYAGSPEDELKLVEVCDVVSAVTSCVERALDVLHVAQRESPCAIQTRMLKQVLSRSEGAEDEEIQLIEALCLWEQFSTAGGSGGESKELGRHVSEGAAAVEGRVRVGTGTVGQIEAVSVQVETVVDGGSSYAEEARRRLRLLTAAHELKMIQEAEWSREAQQKALLSDTESIRDAYSSAASSLQVSRSQSPSHGSSADGEEVVKSSAASALTGPSSASTPPMSILEPGLDGSLNLDDDEVIFSLAGAGAGGGGGGGGGTAERRLARLPPPLSLDEQAKSPLEELEKLSTSLAGSAPHLAASLLTSVHTMHGRSMQDLTQRRDKHMQLRKQTWTNARGRARKEWQREQEAQQRHFEHALTRSAERTARANQRSEALSSRRRAVTKRLEEVVAARRRADVYMLVGAAILAIGVYLATHVWLSEKENVGQWLVAQMGRLCSCMVAPETCMGSPGVGSHAELSVEDVDFMSRAYEDGLFAFSARADPHTTNYWGIVDWEDARRVLYTAAADVTTPVLDAVGEMASAATGAMGHVLGRALTALGISADLVNIWASLPLVVTCSLASACRVIVFLVPYYLLILMHLHHMAQVMLPPALMLGLWRPLVSFFGTDGRTVVFALCIHGMFSWVLICGDGSVEWLWVFEEPRLSLETHDNAGAGAAAAALVTAAASSGSSYGNDIGEGANKASLPRKSWRVPIDSVRIRFWPRRLALRWLLLWVLYPLMLCVGAFALAWASVHKQPMGLDTLATIMRWAVGRGWSVRSA